MLTISACDDPKQQMAQQMQQSQVEQTQSDNRSQGKLPSQTLSTTTTMPVQAAELITPYVYAATGLRSPFKVHGAVLVTQNQPQTQLKTPPAPSPPPVLVVAQPAQVEPVQPEPVAQRQPGPPPDAGRPRQPLEAYGLSELIYRGMMATGNTKAGLIQRPDGAVLRVGLGQYLGQRSGRIVEITATQINLIETVFDPQVGYKPMPASLIAPISR
ncbi:pilus assembly protein PilP [Psychrobacter sp. FDAARGOS_221]|uniref:pilus assembly protein PilP n=1 Tax=Psychrobacter sp. FDAARGOS_221 TaxID=1975705 RepID=UPI00187D3317|nr:pilus assembly protein PilP [Psychrobacter sp. FDAARGOS_221]